MKPKLLFRLLFLALLGGAIAPAPTFAAEPLLTVAVFNFESTDEDMKDLGPKLAALLSANLSAEPNLITVERTELDKVLGEQELGLSGTVSPDTAAKVGHLTGAKILVTGRAFKAGRELVVVAKIIGTETSRVFGEVVRSNGGVSVADLAADLARKVAKVATDRAESLLAKVETRPERIERLRKTLKGGKLPAVSVRIPEQHFGQPVRDPAAQTELLLILEQCGFTIVDESSKEKPDLEITGEAFSALGLRKGNLISCKARLEVKVNDLNARKLLAVDRQTSMAVDLTEPTAAKTALQNAAAELADRLVPKLAPK